MGKGEKFRAGVQDNNKESIQYLAIMQPEYSESPGKNVFTLQNRKDGPHITIRSNFDSGNIGKVQLGINGSIVIFPAYDCAGTQNESHAKGWFHFGVSGSPVGSRIKFVVKKMNQLGSQGKFSDYFRPVYSYAEGPWERMEQATVFNRQDDVELHFQMRFDRNSEVFIAYSYPFSFTQCQKLINELKNQARPMKAVYFHDEILINSVEGRPLHLLTISSNDQKLTHKEAPIDEHLFTRDKTRAFKFQQAKKIILVSGRVHPGEAPASHTMNGLLKFLLSKDARADILRKNFVFKIIPMLNPDGVYNGHYRMDTLNQNLNRFYLNPNPFTQPSCFALRKLGEYYKMEDRLCFYIDLHAHPQKKGNFIYGNALDSPQEQINTQLFPKLLAMNCVEFDYENSCFSKNHMTLKDRNEDLTKQGCGRVVFHKNLQQIYSYTMECGYTSSGSLNQLSALTNPHRKFERLGVIHDDIDNLKSGYYSTGKPLYLTIRSYENLGRCILIAVLDLFGKNPYSRVPNSNYKTLDGIRSVIGDQINKSNKDFKVYSNGNNSVKAPINFNIKRADRKKTNQTFAVGRSLPKAVIGGNFLQKKIFSSKFIEREKVGRTKDTDRRRTLPKMKVHK